MKEADDLKALNAMGIYAESQCKPGVVFKQVEEPTVADGAGPHVSDVLDAASECLRVMIPIVRRQTERLHEDFNREFDRRFWGKLEDSLE